MDSLLIILSGLPFSGKSTLAQQLSRELNIQVLSYDNDIYAVHKSTVPDGTSAAKEFDMIEAIAREEIAKILKDGRSLIYDDLALDREDRIKLTALASSCNAKSVLIYFDTPFSVIEERRKKNIEINNRDHISDSKLYLDMSLLQPPHDNENAIIITPDTTTKEIMSAIHTCLDIN